MNFTQLIMALGAKYPLTVIHATEAPDVRDVVLIDGTEQAYEDDVLYFGLNEGLKSPMQRVVVEKGREEEEGCLALIPGVSLFAAFNQARNLIDSSSGHGLYEDLVRVADKTHKIDDVLNAASLSLGNSLVFCDTNFKIISSSVSIPVIDPIWVDNIKRGYCNYEFIAAVDQLKIVRNVANTSDVSEVTCKESHYLKLSSKVLVNGFQIGFVLMIASETMLQTANFGMLKSVSLALSYTVEHYVGYLAHFSDRAEHLLYALLVGASACDVSLELHDLGFPSHMLALSFRGENKQSPYELMDSIEEEGCLHGVKLTYHEDAVAALFPLEESIGLSSAQRVSLEKIAEKYKMRIGISFSFSHIEDFADFYRQAVSALAFTSRLGKESRVADYRDIELYDLLSQFGDKASLPLFRHPVLDLLLKHDKENNSQLYDTLCVFVEEGGSIKNTAARLFLHRNSLMYRLARIKELSGMDISDPSTLFLLRFSYAIDRLK
ncbi:MAG: helix-turn-helix domain-containing protein [Sphaerochaetaceae bacterium]